MENVFGEIAAQIVESDSETQHVVPQDVNNTEEQPTNSSSVVESIPYDRFKEVNDEKKEWKNRYDQLLATVHNQNQQPVAQQPQKPAEVPKFDTVEELIAYNEQRVKEAVERELRPIQEQATRQSISRNVESFFASRPDAAAVRKEMDAYTATLPEYRKQTVLAGLAQGDTSVLTEIFYTVASQKTSQVQGLVSEQAKGEINKVMPAQQYRTVKSIPASQEKIQQDVSKGNFKSFFQQVAEKEFGR